MLFSCPIMDTLNDKGDVQIDHALVGRIKGCLCNIPVEQNSYDSFKPRLGCSVKCNSANIRFKIYAHIHQHLNNHVLSLLRR